MKAAAVADPPYDSPSAFTGGHALIVGVGEYRVHSLNVAQVVADAQGVAAALVDACAYRPDQVELLTGGQATRQALFGALRGLAARAPDDATVLVFLSSHGEMGEDGNYHIVTSDTEFSPSGQVRVGTGLSGEELIDLLRDIRAQRLVCIINTCFSGEASAHVGGVLSSGGSLGTAHVNSALTLELSRGTGRALLTSSRPHQVSRYLHHSSYTYFGQALIDGLRGQGVKNAEGYIGLYELYAHLYEATRRVTGEQQEPMLTVIDGVGKMPLALHPRRADEASSGPLQSMPPAGMAVEVLPSSLDRAFLESRASVLADVREHWVGEVLERGLYAISPLRPKLLDTPQALPQPLGMTVERYKRPPRPLQPGETILQLFNASGGRMLIRGEPGGGKTTLLLELARDLTTYATREPLAPIPVVLLLRWWADQRLPFAQWLVKQIATVYTVSRDRVKEWVDNDQLVLLLDGLDDVPPDARDSCVAALNEFLAAHGSTRIVLCCQTDSYERLAVQPQLKGGAILIRPLDQQQVADYLNDERLATLRAALERNDELRQLAQIPLMLNIMAIAYEDQSSLPVPLETTTEAWSKQLFDAYIAQRLGTVHGRPPYPPEQTKQWLSWLARGLMSDQQVDFYILRLEQLQEATDRAVEQMRVFTPTSVQQGWLPTVRLRRIFRGIAGTVSGFGIAAVLLLVWQEQLGWAGATLVVILVALFLGLMAALLPEQRVAVAKVHMVSVAEAFDLKLRRDVWPGLGALTGLFGLLGVLGGEPLLGFALGCGVAAVAGLFYLAAIHLSRLIAQRLVSRRHTPVRRLIILVLSVFVSGLLAGLVCGLAGGLTLGWLLGELRVGVLAGSLLGLVVGFLFALIQGLAAGGQSLVNHYVLRWLLARGGYAPWDLSAFLHYVSGLTLIYRVGDGYMFVHRRLLEHLAGQDIP